jgi:hypothetical protein
MWRAEWDPPADDGPVIESCKLRGVFDAFSSLGVAAEPLIYSDDTVDGIREQALDLDGVLVWVNPIEQGLTRAKLDPLLREISDAGVWVSAHPDVILKMATKQVLVDTRDMSWGTDTKLHRTAAGLRADLPSRLARHPALVLKQHRGMGGNGVWKVEADDPETNGETMLRVQHAVRESAPEQLTLDEFATRCEPYFANGAVMVDQPFQQRLAEGMIRVYLTKDQVVGFTHQYPRALLPPDEASPARAPARIFELPSAPSFVDLRARMESEWMPELQQILDLDTDSLPVIWDADFLYGKKTESGDDRYVLCEINASSTFAFPENAMPTVARAAIREMEKSRR